MQKIKNILIDYGNVIFMIDFIKTQQAFNQLGILNSGEIFAHAGQIKLFDDFDRGTITSSQFRDGLRCLTNNPTLKDNEIDEAWNALLIGVPEGKYEILEQLNKKYRTFLLSNNNEIHYTRCIQTIQKDYGIKDNSIFFEYTYYSHLIGMRKPDAEIFEYVLKEQGLKPDETLFIDDSPQHLQTAEILGIHTALCSIDNPLELIVRQWGLLD